MSPASPMSSGARQDSCYFRTRLLEEERSDELDDIMYAQPTTPLGRDLPGNPYISPADMLYPESTTTITTSSSSENVVKRIRSAIKSESNDPINFSFLTVEEFTDTVMVDPLDENKGNAAASNNNSRKRKSLSSIQSFSQPRKRVARTAITALTTTRPGAHQCQGNGSGPGATNREEEDISDNWSLITDVDIARIPAYGPSAIMEMTQSIQALLFGRAMAKAREARRKMRTLERSCRTLLRNTFEYRGHGGRTKCISVGGGSVW